MGIEIERKFLVVGDVWRSLSSPVLYRQGYLNSDKHRTVRIRVAGERAQLTIKGISRVASRAEFEYDVPLDDAKEMLWLCEGPLIEKNRYRISVDDVVWEVDEFLGQNAGLIVAEIELLSEDQRFAKPTWVGREVTGDVRYFNSSLVTSPFSTW